MLKIKEYAKNVGKSVVYTASEVLGEEYSTVKDFTTTNQEIFKEAYGAVRDYRTTFARVKKTVEQSDVYVAANLDIKNLFEDIKSGKFYNKERDLEYESKFGGDLVKDTGWDMDSEDFDWSDNADITAGDKVIATAIKKNNKLSTAIMADVITTGNKAIVDTSRDNTTMLFVQQERLMNKFGGKLDTITSIMKNQNEASSKMQSQHFQNSAKFMTNIEKKTDKIVAQLDEMLQMQRQVYQSQNQQEKERKRNTVTDIASSGIPNLREYGKQIKSNAYDFINQLSGGALQMTGAMEGANILAMFAASPLKMAVESVVRKSISSEFKSASKGFNENLRGSFSNLMSRAYNARMNDEDKFAQMLGSIFGLKFDKESDTMDTGKFNKGPVPFDGITKKAVTEVIPFYLRKMTSMITGEDEQIFDYKTGKWTTVKAVQKRHNDWKDAGHKQAFGDILSVMHESIGKSPNAVMTSKFSQDRLDEQMDKFQRALYRTNGDFNSILNKPMEYGLDSDFVNFIKKIFRDNESQGQYYYKTEEVTGAKGRTRTKVTGIDRSRGAGGVRTGVNVRNAISNYARTAFDTKAQRAQTFRDMERDPDILERILYSEGILGDPTKDKNIMGVRNQHGDFNMERAFKSPFAQAMLYVQDNNGYNLFDYLRHMKIDLSAIRNNGLFGLGSTTTDTSNMMEFEKTKDYKPKFNYKYGGSGREKDEKRKARDYDNYNQKYINAVKEWEEKGRIGPKPRKAEDYVDLAGFIADQHDKLERDLKKDFDNNKKNKKNIYDTLADWGLMTKEEARKYTDKNFDPKRSLTEQLRGEVGGMSKLAILGDYARQMVQKPWEAATDAVIKTDVWLHNLFFEHAFKRTKEDGEVVEEKGLFGMMKEKFKQGFEDLTDKISNKISNAVEKLNEKFGEKFFKPVKEFLLGKRADSESDYQGGLLSGVLNAGRKYFKKNAEDVKNYAKRTLKDTKDSIFGKKSEETDSVTPEPDVPIKYYQDTAKKKALMAAIKEFEAVYWDSPLLSIYENFYPNHVKIFPSNTAIKKYILWCEAHKIPEKEVATAGPMKKYFFDITTDHSSKHYQSIINSINRLDRLKDRKLKVIPEGEEVPAYDNLASDQTVLAKATESKYRRKKVKSPEDLRKELLKKGVFPAENASEAIAEYINWLSSQGISLDRGLDKNNISRFQSKNKQFASSERRDEMIEAIRSRTATLRAKHGREAINSNQDTTTTTTNSADTIFNHVENVKKNNEILEKILSPLNKISSLLEKIANLPVVGNNNPPSGMAKGGINTGSAFPSVLSPGETLTVPGRGTATIQKTGIYNIPTGGIVVNPKGAAGRSADAARERAFVNKLSFNAEPGGKDSNLVKINEYVNGSEGQELIGNAMARGTMGLGAGILLGGPLLGAGIGIASAFANKSNGFANAIFGTATGEVDENGKLKRHDDGLLSKELQKAIPDIKKFGLLGALAGLITPFGPVGGLLIGSAAGFAKNNGLIQETLFGEGGLIDPKKKEKLKKALPAMGLGALAGAFLGPFGLLGNALLGSAAGFVTTTDSFKDAVLGKQGPDGKRIGGFVGLLKKSVDPLKNFGSTIINGTLDAIFGKKKGEGEDAKREGGIFGMLKDQVVMPLAEGIKPIIQEIKNRFKDITNFAKDRIKKFSDSHVGGHLTDKLSNAGAGLARAGIGIAKGAAWVGATPLMAGAHAIKGLGNHLRRKQIRRGRASDLTADERIAFRQRNFLAGEVDEYSEFDQALSTMSKTRSVEEMKRVRDMMGMLAGREDMVNDELVNAKKTMSDQFDNYLQGSGRKGKTGTAQIMKQINRGNFEGALKLIERGDFDTRKGTPLSDADKANMIQAVHDLANTNKLAKERVANIKASGVDIEKTLMDELGIKFDPRNKKMIRQYQEMINRDIVHKEAGEKLTGERDPLKNNTIAVDRLTEVLEDSLKVQLGEDEAIRKKYKIRNKKKAWNSMSHAERLEAISKNPDEWKEISQNTDNGEALTGYNEAIKDLRRKKDNELFDTFKEKGPEGTADYIYRSLGTSAAKIWDDSVKDNPHLMSKSGKYTLVLDGDIYEWTNKEEHEKMREAYIRKYVLTKIQNPADRERVAKAMLKSEVKFKGLAKPFATFEKLGIGKTAAILMAGPLAVGGVVGASLALKGAKAASPHIKNAAFNLKQKAKIGAGNLKQKLNYDPTDEELDVNAQYAKLSAEEKEEIRNNGGIAKWRQNYLKSHKRGLIAEAKRKLYYDPADKINKKIRKDYSKLSDTEKDEIRSNGGIAKWRESKLKDYYKQDKPGLLVGVRNRVVASEKRIKNGEASGTDRIIAAINKGVKTLGDIVHKDDKKEPSKLTKWLSSAFGIGKLVVGVPLMVGFMHQTLMPFLKNKVGPWILGKKNQEGEYEGGLFSGIVNPLKNWFGKKFANVKHWFANTGPYTDPNTGWSGALIGVKNIFAKVVDTWKVGAEVLIEKWVPRIVETLTANLVPTLVAALKGAAKGIWGFLTKKDGQTEVGSTAFNLESFTPGGYNDPSSGGSGSASKSSIVIPNTITGSTKSIGTMESTSVKPSGTSSKNMYFGPKGVIEDDTAAATGGSKMGAAYPNPPSQLKAAATNDNDVVEGGKDKAGQTVYYAKSDKKKKNPLRKGVDGKYYSAADLIEMADPSLVGDENWDAMLNEDADNADPNDALDTHNTVLKRMAWAMTTKAGRKSMGRAGRVLGKFSKGFSKILPVWAKPAGWAGRVLGKGMDTVGSLSEKGASKAKAKLIERASKHAATNTAATSAVDNVVTKSKVPGGAMMDDVADIATSKPKAGAMMDDISDVAGKKFKNGALMDDVADIAGKPKANKIGAMMDDVADIATPKAGGKKASKLAGLVDKIKKPFANKGAGKSKVGEKVLKEAAEEAGEGAAKKTAKNVVKEAAESATKSKNAGVIGKILDLIKGALKKLFNSKAFTKVLGSKGGTIAKKAVGAIGKIISGLKTKLDDLAAKAIAKIASKLGIQVGAAATGVGVVINIAMYIGSFISGCSDARNILGIISEPTALEKALAGVVAFITDNFLIVIPRSTVASIVIDILGPIIAKEEYEEFKQKQEEDQKRLQEFNQIHGTDYTLEEYNYKYNRTMLQKIGDGAKKALKLAGKGLKASTKFLLANPVEKAKTVVKVAKKAGKKVKGGIKKLGKGIKKLFGNAEADEGLEPFLDDDGMLAIPDEAEEMIDSEGVPVEDETNNLTFINRHPILNFVNKAKSVLSGDMSIIEALKSSTEDNAKNFKEIIANNPLIGTVTNGFNDIKSLLSGEKSVGEVIKGGIKRKAGGIKSLIGKLKETTIGKAISSKVDTIKTGISNAKSVIKGDMSIKDAIKSTFGKGVDNAKSVIGDFGIGDALNKATGGFKQVGNFIKKFTSQNKTNNDSIDSGKIDPSNPKFWEIKDPQSGNPFIDSMFKMKENMSRLIKAPFSMVAETMSNVNNVIGPSGISESSSSSSGSSDEATKDKSGKLSIWQRIKNKFKGIFGKGKDEDRESGKGDDGHIYQRDYTGSFQTPGDTESQSLADSGCGPAAAATVLNRYGKKGNMRSAAKFATANGYKEVNGGTYPEYFKDYLNRNGITANETQSNEEVINSLANGKPVIMMGQDRKNKGTTPYGSEYSHYVVATGLDRNGNVIVEDSEDKRGQTRYNLGEVLKNTSVKITTGGHGKFGRGDSALSVLSNYSSSMVKAIYGPYYSALFGDDDAPTGGNSTNNTIYSSGNKGSTNMNYDADITDSGETESRKKIIWDYFVKNGFSDTLAAAIMGNMQRESGFNPSISEIASGVKANRVEDIPHNRMGTHVNGSGMGFGLIQWSYAEGHAALYNWCTGNNCDPNTLDGQVKWVVAQMKGTNIEAATNTNNAAMFNGADGHGTMSWNYDLIKRKGGLEGFNNMSISEAVTAFYDCVERGWNRDSDIKLSIGYANNIYNQFASGSGKGKGSNTDHTSPTISSRPSGRANKRYNRQEFINTKIGKRAARYGYGIRRYGSGKYGRADEEEEATTTTTAVPEDTAPANSGASLLTQIGDYSGKLVKQIYGDYYTALFGDDSSDGNSGNNNYENSDVIADLSLHDTNAIGQIVYTAAAVWKAMGPVSYSNYVVDTITVNGRSVKARRDCSGFMSGVVHALGYKTINDWGGNDSMQAHNFHSVNIGDFIKNEDGSDTDDWVVFPLKSIDDLNPGDIVSSTEHCEMFLYKTGNNEYQQFGFNAGDDDPIKKSYNFATALLNVAAKHSSNGEFVGPHADVKRIIEEARQTASATSVLWAGCSGWEHKPRMDMVCRYRGRAAGPIEKSEYANSGNGRGKNIKSSTSARANSSMSNQEKFQSRFNNKLSKNRRHDPPILNSNRLATASSTKLSPYSTQYYESHKHQIQNSVRTGGRGINNNGHYSNINPSTGLPYESDYETNNYSTTTYNNNSNTSNSQDMSAMIAILETIADNSAKTDQIVQLLAAIVTNTSVDLSKSNESNNKIRNLINQMKNNNSSSSAPVMGLNNILSNNGTNIADAVYAIAKS